MARPERTLILVDGSLASLLACAGICEETARRDDAPRGLMLPFPPSAAKDQRLSILIRRLGELFSMEVLGSPAETPGAERSPGEQECRDLLGAAYVAARHSCTRVLWAVNASAGDSLDLDRIAAAHDRAVLVARLAAIDSATHGVPSLRIDTPYVDLTIRQLADLAVDMDLPIESSGWWGGLTSAGRESWGRALREAGWLPSRDEANAR